MFRSQFSRRSVLGMGAAAGAVMLTGMPARAAGQIVVTTWGGDNERAIRESAGAAMGQERGTSVIFDTGTPSARKTKLLAEAGRPRNSIDVVHLTDSDMYQMQRQGFLLDIDAQVVPGYDRILEELRTPYSVPTNFSALVLVYNRNHVPSMTSWKDLWKDDYKGRIGMTDLSYDKIIQIASATFGSGTSDYAPGYEALLALKELGVRIYPSNEACGNAFASEEIVAAIQWKGRAVQWAEAGLPLDYAVPVEGGYPTSFEMAITKNSGNVEEAGAFLDFMLRPESQLALAEAIGQAPVVHDAALPPELQEKVAFTAEQRQNFIKLDHEYAANHAAEALDWWNQKFKS